MIRLLTVFAFILVWFPALAETCGDADAPCTIDQGDYHIILPEGAGPHPVLMFLHGFGGTGKGIMRNKGLLRPILDRGYAVIAPQGLPFREGMRGGSWNSMKREGRRDDVAFLTSVMAAAEASFNITADRALLAGFSGGGMMTWRVLCDAPDRFSAYAPIAGMLWLPLPETCAGAARIQHTHGWSDEVVPIEGRSVANGQFTQGNIFVGFDILRDASACVRDDPDEYGAEGDYLIRKWTHCSPGSALEMVLHPGGHRIPAGWSIMAIDWFEGLSAQK